VQEILELCNAHFAPSIDALHCMQMNVREVKIGTRPLPQEDDACSTMDCKGSRGWAGEGSRRPPDAKPIGTPAPKITRPSARSTSSRPDISRSNHHHTLAECWVQPPTFLQTLDKIHGSLRHIWTLPSSAFNDLTHNQ